MAILARAQTQNLPEPSPVNTLLSCETTQGFQSLFTGTLASFQSHFADYKQNNDTNTDVDPLWKVCAADSSICVNKTGSQSLRSRSKYSDFDLRLDYRDDGDEGIFYRGLTRTAKWSGTAMEYWVLDDTTAHRNQVAGAAWDIFPVTTLPYHNYATGQWNSVRIVAKGDSVEHWLNNVKVLGYRFWNARWVAAITAAGKTGDPDKGQLTSGCKCMIPNGYIGLQGDHPTNWHVRNLRVTADGANVQFGPAQCPTTPVRPNVDLPAFSVEQWPGAMRLNLKTASILRAELDGLNGRVAGRVVLEDDGSSLLIRDWKQPGIYFLRAYAAGDKPIISQKIFLP